MKLTATDLKQYQIIDEIILEGKGLSVEPETGLNNLKKSLIKHITKLKKVPLNTLVQKRYQKFRKMGEFEESVIENETSTN